MNRFGWGFAVLLAVVAGLALFGGGRGTPRAATDAGAPSATALVIPVEGVSAHKLADTWEQSREGGARVHQAIDIPAPGGTPVVAAMAGHVEKLFDSARGGLTVYIRDTSGRWLIYYAHLSGYVAGLREGQGVAAGEQIGFVGDTGNAGQGNTHLHFALHRMSPGDRWYEGAPVNPYPLLAGKRDAR
ncbi:M23 family metallopeptidase [Sphingomonas sp. SUN039]|uniref:M23 family metallopeptidase n=1 Tax=Sphingomonas sp. SUN039 TaxID=2937787 RepID=UPI002164C521|nr:M23 family metallopeptidase [Sphingomonas sp. SUN039]UVO53157.1 M23 family metallopeptidase [Sphingomonas sp. SUN039]